MQNMFILFSYFVTASFYSLSFQDVDAVNRTMSLYVNKKILIVNIATESSRVNQLSELQQLQQQYADSLIVLAFPSNSFGKEPKSNLQIKQFCQSQHGATFLIAAKNSVVGPSIQPVYNWLTKITENEMMNEPVKGDFQKYLINREGRLIGVFSPSVSPLDPQITNAIIEN